MAQRRPRVPLDTPDMPMHIRMLAKIRLKYHWTQAELGTQLNVSGRTIRQWENQITEPKAGWMAAFRELLGE